VFAVGHHREQIYQEAQGALRDAGAVQRVSACDGGRSIAYQRTVVPLYGTSPCRVSPDFSITRREARWSGTVTLMIRLRGMSVGRQELLRHRPARPFLIRQDGKPGRCTAGDPLDVAAMPREEAGHCGNGRIRNTSSNGAPLIGNSDPVPPRGRRANRDPSARDRKSSCAISGLLAPFAINRATARSRSVRETSKTS
jgi:hypothetical protein